MHNNSSRGVLEALRLTATEGPRLISDYLMLKQLVLMTAGKSKEGLLLSTSGTKLFKEG
ncbi:hypothetical protein Ga0123461_1066 [Mariprofundus aestuarium]|uniref:Uncharacterized protein n=2 Tax=Mariprofundus aestuarium TaxID=1921086 RepID=A0A2K8KX38_MARES|nr:hypothetical protein Ga0123461_1066 [Mariprofundus aestuarium]